MTAAIDRTPKPCLHKQANHQHGDRATYVLDRCRCLPCCYAASVYELNRQKRNAYGRSNYVDAEPARARCRELMAAGVGLKTIVKRSGVSQGVIWKLLYGKKRADGAMIPSRRVTRATAEKLLVLDPADRSLLANGARVNATGTARRLQALTCLGWSIGRLAETGGLDRQRLDAAINGRPVVAATVREVKALYERLWDEKPPAGTHRERIAVSRALNRAKASGWAPPLAWDDDTIDDPAAAPFAGDVDEDLVDELAVEAVLDGHRMHLTGATLHAAVQALAAGGHQPTAIAERLNTYTEKVMRLRDRIEPPRRKRSAA